MNTVNKEHDLGVIYALCCLTTFLRCGWSYDTRLREVDEDWDADDENSRPDLSVWEQIIDIANWHAKLVGVPPTIDARVFIESVFSSTFMDPEREEYLARLEEDLEEKEAA